jgi:putative DNA methylase
MSFRKKLIEVALPLEAINQESAREKSIRHGHPSTLHLWWARRPLAACRAVLFASLVDDPSEHPDKFPTVEDQKKERQRLHDLIGRIENIETKAKSEQIVRGLVSWDDIKDTKVIEEAQKEIARSLAWNNGHEPPTKPEAVRKYLSEHAPPIYDPFCGGGSIPLEAQRLGLEAHGSDLNPVAVLITKALIEFPPKFANQPPVNPEVRQTVITPEVKVKGKKQITDTPSLFVENEYFGAQGLASDVRYYGQWMRDEAEKQIGDLYPKVQLPQGGEATVIAWLWARTVKCPNPACRCQMPLVRSFQLSTKKGKEAWVEPVIDNSQNPSVVKFEVKIGQGTPHEGTVNRRGAVCVACESPVTFDWIRSEAKFARMDVQLMAIVAEGNKGRIYLSPSKEQQKIAASAQPKWKPDTDLPEKALGFRVQAYGMTKHADLFTSRQLVALTTFCDLVGETRKKILADGLAAGRIDDGLSLNDGGTGATAYADAIATYLAFAVDRCTDYWSSIATWHNSNQQVRCTFARQAIPMTWDFIEANPLSNSSGGWISLYLSTVEALTNLNCNAKGYAKQIDATTSDIYAKSIVVSTDPPYYDNIGYADLSDFFYVWL